MCCANALVCVGVLCGDCTEGLGFSALLGSCVECSNAYSSLIVLLAVVDVAVIVVLLGVSKPVPLFFYPVLFHLQLLPLYTDHFPVTFDKVRPYLAYVASGLGLYFPYDFCLYEEASALATYVFRYIPLFLAVIIVPIAISIRKRCSPPSSWHMHGVWWLVLLLYTPAVHTSVAILHCPAFPVQDLNSTRFSTRSRWFVNGNVECFTGAHIPLGILAMLVLFLYGVSLPLLLLFAIFAKKRQLKRRPWWLDLAAVAFQQSFKYQWWGALELFRRLVLVMLAVVFPRNNYPVIFTLFVLTALTSFMKPYGDKDSHHKKGHWYAWAVNALDVFLTSNVLVLLLLRNTQSVEENYEKFPAPEQLGVPLASVAYDRCSPVGGLTEFVIFLTPLYYLPLFVSIVSLLLWLCRVTSAASAVKSCNSKKMPVARTYIAESEDIGSDMASKRNRTQTVVDFRSYDPDDPSTPQGKKHKRFSFRRLSIRRKDKSQGSSRRSSTEKTETKSNDREMELKDLQANKKLKVSSGLKSCSLTIVEEGETCIDPDVSSYTEI